MSSSQTGRISDSTPLSGTHALRSDDATAFYDRYARQYQLTARWLRAQLAGLAAKRSQERTVDTGWLVAHRQELRRISGAELIRSELQSLEFWRTGEREFTYFARTSQNVALVGLVLVPSTAVRASVLYTAGTVAQTRAASGPYLDAGYCVVIPFLPTAAHSFLDDDRRHWYRFNDEELVHALFFIIGGSLSGLEAVELQIVADRIATHVAPGAPVVLDIGGRYMLSAAISAALRPSSYAVMVVKDSVDALDHLEAGTPTNIIWDFHKHFDAVSILALSQPVNLVFQDDAYSGSAIEHQVRALISHPQPDVPTGVTRHCKAAGGLADLLTELADILGQACPYPIHVPGTVAAVETTSLYKASITTRIDFLTACHEAARENRIQAFDFTRQTPEEYATSVGQSMDRLMGSLPARTINPEVRTRLVDDRPRYRVFQVVFESVPSIEVAGYLLLPHATGSLPAVICQHGRGGRPESLLENTTDHEGGWIYDRFAARLAEKDYVVFVPFMNWGWGSADARNYLVQLAFPQGLTPNRLECAQLHSIVDFLQSRPEVLRDKIAFYGLSYGGHASLWLGSQERRLAAVVTSGFFNDWQRKITSLEVVPPFETPHTFPTVEEGFDMFNFNALNEAGHAEMATRFAPRPYFIEHGLQDPAAPRPWVDQEFTKVRAVYAWLSRPENVTLSHFDGPHRIWAEESFAFLHRWLKPSAAAPT